MYQLPRVDVPHIYVCAWALGCFYSLISTQTFWRTLSEGGDKECPFSGITAGKRCSECGPVPV